MSSLRGPKKLQKKDTHPGAALGSSIDDLLGRLSLMPESSPSSPPSTSLEDLLQGFNNTSPLTSTTSLEDLLQRFGETPVTSSKPSVDDVLDRLAHPCWPQQGYTSSRPSPSPTPTARSGLSLDDLLHNLANPPHSHPSTPEPPTPVTERCSDDESIGYVPFEGLEPTQVHGESDEEDRRCRQDSRNNLREYIGS
jgi:hypothetical protein